MKHAAVSKVLSETTKANIASSSKDFETDDIYRLPLSQEEPGSSEDEYSSETDSSPTKHWDLHTIDEKSVHFKSLPIEMRHEILTELKETRKQSSWGRLHEMPRESGDFSTFQMKRLLKRYSVQASLEEIEKEMGGNSLSLQELESILKEHGVVTSDNTGRRIASDENTRYLLIKDVKKAMDDAKKLEEANKIDEARKVEESEDSCEEADNIEIVIEETKNTEFERDLQTAIELSLQDMPSTSKTRHVKGKTPSNRLTSAKNYMTEYSGLTPNEIEKIIGGNTERSIKCDDVSMEINPETSDLKNLKKPELKETTVSRNDNVEEEANYEKATSAERIESEHIDLEKSASMNSVKQMQTEEDMSESDSDDFMEVADETASNAKENSLEIIINPNSSTVDDLFNDIFEQQKESNEPNLTNPISSVESEILEKQTESPSSFVELPLKDSKKPNLSNLTSNEQIISEEVSKAEEIKTLIGKYIDKNAKTIEETTTKLSLTTKQLKEIETNLEIERKELITERSTKERLSNNITDQMYQEAQVRMNLFIFFLIFCK